jgi:hypothetical protein
MKKDIPAIIAEGIAVAVVKEQNELNEAVWNVYLLNMKKVAIENVLVSSRGYGEKENQKVETSQLRHFIEAIKPKSYQKIEPIIEDVFGISNQYWVSFYENKTLYDKKYIFLAESIKEDNFITIPILNKQGVMIQ